MVTNNNVLQDDEEQVGIVIQTGYGHGGVEVKAAIADKEALNGSLIKILSQFWKPTPLQAKINNTTAASIREEEEEMSNETSDTSKMEKPPNQPTSKQNADKTIVSKRASFLKMFWSPVDNDPTTRDNTDCQSVQDVDMQSFSSSCLQLDDSEKSKLAETADKGPNGVGLGPAFLSRLFKPMDPKRDSPTTTVQEEGISYFENNSIQVGSKQDHEPKNDEKQRSSFMAVLFSPIKATSPKRAAHGQVDESDKTETGEGQRPKELADWVENETDDASRGGLRFLPALWQPNDSPKVITNKDAAPNTTSKSPESCETKKYPSASQPNDFPVGSNDASSNDKTEVGKKVKIPGQRSSFVSMFFMPAAPPNSPFTETVYGSQKCSTKQSPQKHGAEKSSKTPSEPSSRNQEGLNAKTAAPPEAASELTPDIGSKELMPLPELVQVDALTLRENDNEGTLLGEQFIEEKRVECLYLNLDTGLQKMPIDARYELTTPSTVGLEDDPYFDENFKDGNRTKEDVCCSFCW